MEKQYLSLSSTCSSLWSTCWAYDLHFEFVIYMPLELQKQAFGQKDVDHKIWPPNKDFKIWGGGVGDFEFMIDTPWKLQKEHLWETFWACALIYNFSQNV